MAQNISQLLDRFYPARSEIRSDESSIRLKTRVIDTGIGIPSQYFKELFNPFTQADLSTTRKFGGTGLGLSICKQLITLLGGTITVSSELGKGAEFELNVTFKKAKRVRIKDRPLSLRNKSMKRRVLVAEDNEVNRLLIERNLKNFGHQSLVVQNGLEALEECKKAVFDLILIDCHMPEMDGFEATKHIRNDADSLNHDTPIIATTANVVKGTREKCLNAGMNHYLAKPLPWKRLEQIISHTPSRTRYFSVERLNKLAVLNKEGLPDLRIELVESFVKDLSVRIEKIKMAFMHGNHKLIQAEAHALKSSAAAIGAMKISVVCRKLEEVALSENSELLDKSIKTLKRHEGPTHRILKAYLSRNTSVRTECSYAKTP